MPRPNASSVDATLTKPSLETDGTVARSVRSFLCMWLVATAIEWSLAFGPSATVATATLLQVAAASALWTAPLAGVVSWIAFSWRTLFPRPSPWLPLVPVAGFAFLSVGQWIHAWSSRAFVHQELAGAAVPSLHLAALTVMGGALAVLYGRTRRHFLRLSHRASLATTGGICIALGVVHIARFPALLDHAATPVLIEVAGVASCGAWALRFRRLRLHKIGTAGVGVAIVGLFTAYLHGGRIAPLSFPVATATIHERALMAAVISRATTRLGDADGDGFSRWFGGIDCDDTRADVNPLATEVPGNGVDEDCFEGDLPANAVAADRAARRAQEAPPRRRVRNLLLVTVDTMRADALTERVAPTLSEVASRSTQFTRAYTHAPMTRRAFPALLAGRYPSNIHWLDERTDNLYTVSHPDNRFLAEVLRDDGVQTAAVLAFRYARLAHFDQGFEIQRIHPASRFRRETNADVIVDDAVSLLADFRESGEPPPFFLWVHFYEPHYGYEPHEGIQTESDPRARYDGEVRYVDGELGRLFASLHDLDFAGDTAVVFTSDHGEEFGEHGGRWHGDLYPEDLRVPLFIFVPGGSPRSLDVPTGLIDLAPTMLELVGLPIPEEFDGDSLVPFIEGEPPPENRTVFAETFPDAKVERRMLALVDRRWHYIADFESGARELFDLDTDPTAQHNVYIDEPEAAVTMEELLRRHMALRVGPLRVSVADRR